MLGTVDAVVVSAWLVVGGTASAVVSLDSSPPPPHAVSATTSTMHPGINLGTATSLDDA